MHLLLTVLKNPRLFSTIIMGLQLASAIRWAYERNLQQTVYWVAATLLVYAVTFL